MSTVRANPKSVPSTVPVDVLIVDDRVPELDALEAVLGDLGYRIVRAQSGPEALRLLLKQDFAVILLDIHMPEMDGFEVATTIKQRERSRHTPIVFLTATHDDVAAIYRAYRIGAVDYLTKPFDEVVVRAKVSVFAELFRKEQRIQQQAAELREIELQAKQRELRELRALSERRYRSLVETVPACVLTADVQGLLTYVNRAWIEATGLDLAQARRSWWSAVDVDDRERVREAWQQTLKMGDGFSLEARIGSARRGHRWHALRVLCEHGPDGKPRGWLMMAADCEDLKRAVQLRDDFLSIASHELKTPLTTMLLQLEAAARGAETIDDRARTRLASAARQAQRLNTLVENLLDVARISSGRLHLNLERCDLAETVRDSINRFEEEARRTGTTLEITTAPTVVGSFDPVRVEQVVGNLVSNALKYGSGKPVLVRVESDDENARLAVRDHGIGIRPEDRERIFRRFERAVSHEHYAGMGVGLFVARQIVEAHGGTIAVDSKPGEGATFTVSLPRREAAE